MAETTEPVGYDEEGNPITTVTVEASRLYGLPSWGVLLIVGIIGFLVFWSED